MKTSPFAPDPDLTEDHRSGRREPDAGGDEHEQRAQDQQGERGQRPIEGFLHRPGRAGELGLLDVEELEAGDRADVHPRAGDVGESRRHDEVDPGALEVPAQALQDTTGETAGSRHCDGVDAQLGHCLGNTRERPDDRHRGATGCGVTGRHAGADHLEPGVGLARELGDQGVDLFPAADDEHPVRPMARAEPGPVQDLAGRPPADQQQERPHHEAHGQNEARQLELRHVAGDRDQAPEVDAGAGDPAVLVAADAEHLAVVRAGEDQHHRPAQRQQRPHQDVDREPTRPLRDVGEERQSAEQVGQRAVGDHQVAVQQVVADEQRRRERGSDQEGVEQEESAAQAAQPAGVAGDGHAGPGGRSGDLQLRARQLAFRHYRSHAAPPSLWSTGRMENAIDRGASAG